MRWHTRYRLARALSCKGRSAHYPELRHRLPNLDG